MAAQAPMWQISHIFGQAKQSIQLFHKGSASARVPVLFM